MAGLLGDTGLISGVAAGLQSGMQAYNAERDRSFKVKQYQDQLDAQNLARKQQQEMMQMQGAEHNLIKDEGGNWAPSPQGLMKQGYEMQKLKGEAEQYDPNSPQVKGLLGGLGLNAPGTTLAGVKAVEPLLKYKESKNSSDQAKSEKAGAKQAKIYGDYLENRDKFRGDSAAQQANVNLTAVKNAKAIIAAYPDMNNMPQDQVNLLRTEIAKIAGGGSATQFGTQELGTPTFISGLQHVLSYGENDPKGAQLGAFLKNNINYLNDLEKNNQQIVDQRHLNRFKSTETQLTDEDLHQKLLDENPDDYQLFLNDQQKNKGKKGLVKAQTGLVTEPAQKASGYPKQVRKGNATATVQNANEEKEANAEGFQ